MTMPKVYMICLVKNSKESMKVERKHEKKISFHDFVQYKKARERNHERGPDTKYVSKHE